MQTSVAVILAHTHTCIYSAHTRLISIMWYSKLYISAAHGCFAWKFCPLHHAHWTEVTCEVILNGRKPHDRSTLRRFISFGWRAVFYQKQSWDLIELHQLQPDRHPHDPSQWTSGDPTTSQLPGYEHLFTHLSVRTVDERWNIFPWLNSSQRKIYYINILWSFDPIKQSFHFLMMRIRFIAKCIFIYLFVLLFI